MKNLKTLGLLTVAAMAFVGTASASAASFTAGALGASITESTLTKHVFTITGSTVECREITFAGQTEGTLTGSGLGFTTQSQKVTPLYIECSGPTVVTVTNNGCYYTLNANGSMNITPSSGASCNLTIVANNFFMKCKIVISNQSIPGANTFATNGNHIDVTINASKIDAQVTESTGLCPLTVGTHNDAASYTGKSTVGASGTKVAFDA